MAREKAKDIWFGGATQVFFRWWEEVGGIFVGSFYCNFNFFRKGRSHGKDMRDTLYMHIMCIS